MGKQLRGGKQKKNKRSAPSAKEIEIDAEKVAKREASALNEESFQSIATILTEKGVLASNA